MRIHHIHTLATDWRKAAFQLTPQFSHPARRVTGAALRNVHPCVQTERVGKSIVLITCFD